jgi:hypothetical protein
LKTSAPSEGAEGAGASAGATGGAWVEEPTGIEAESTALESADDAGFGVPWACNEMTAVTNHTAKPIHRFFFLWVPIHRELKWGKNEGSPRHRKSRLTYPPRRCENTLMPVCLAVQFSANRTVLRLLELTFSHMSTRTLVQESTWTVTIEIFDAEIKCALSSYEVVTNIIYTQELKYLNRFETDSTSPRQNE